MSGLSHKFACLATLAVMPVLLLDALDQLNGKQDLTTLANKISQDTSIVIRLLRIANSPFYGMSRETGPLQETVVLLGFNCVRNLLSSLPTSFIRLEQDIQAIKDSAIMQTMTFLNFLPTT